MSKKVGVCINCNREVYTNDIHLCKRCFNEVGVDFLKESEIFAKPEKETIEPVTEITEEKEELEE
jgi:predicted amidophosphoribosyltransferase